MSRISGKLGYVFHAFCIEENPVPISNVVSPVRISMSGSWICSDESITIRNVSEERGGRYVGFIEATSKERLPAREGGVGGAIGPVAF
jgi:hypothetical protein